MLDIWDYFNTLYVRIKSFPNTNESVNSKLTPSSIVSKPSPSNNVFELTPPTTFGAIQIVILLQALMFQFPHLPNNPLMQLNLLEYHH